jgi:hypothetical protein
MTKAIGISRTTKYFRDGKPADLTANEKLLAAMYDGPPEGITAHTIETEHYIGTIRTKADWERLWARIDEFSEIKITH